MKKLEKSILVDCLNSMPNIFTSNSFANKARSMHFPEHFIRHGHLGSFLHKYAVQSDESKRTWYKSKNIIKSGESIDRIEIINTPTIGVNALTPELCIEFLKKHGYKVMRPIQEWQEL